jgi:hypothetical protein
VRSEGWRPCAWIQKCRKCQQQVKISRTSYGSRTLSASYGSGTLSALSTGYIRSLRTTHHPYGQDVDLGTTILRVQSVGSLWSALYTACRTNDRRRVCTRKRESACVHSGVCESACVHSGALLCKDCEPKQHQFTHPRGSDATASTISLLVAQLLRPQPPPMRLA